MKNVSVSKKVTRLLVTIIIVAVTLVMVIPFVWMLSASFKTEADVMKIPIEWIPKYFYIDNYKKVLSIGTTSSTNYHFRWRISTLSRSQLSVQWWQLPLRLWQAMPLPS